MINRLTTKGIFWHFSVQLSCGGQSSENCTYFQSDGNEIGQCRIKICPCSDNICQLRLDFSTFVITGPETTTTTMVVNKCGGKTCSNLGNVKQIFSVLLHLEIMLRQWFAEQIQENIVSNELNLTLWNNFYFAILTKIKGHVFS